MNKNLIVSSSDENYSHLLKELYFSTINLNGYDFAVLDCGLSEDSKEFFKQKNVQVLECKWDIDVPSYKVRGREYLKAQFSRFFLDLYFPGYENYIWMDSDTWIACPDTFDYYIQGSNISKSISKDLAKKYAGHYTLNAGCFAYNKKFDGMKTIKKNLNNASRKGRLFGSDQVALAISLFEDNLDFELLPSYCNWLCEHHMPKFSIDKNTFVEPYIPNHNIGVMHLAGLDEDRSTNVFHKISTTDNKIIEKSLRYKSI